MNINVELSDDEYARLKKIKHHFECDSWKECLVKMAQYVERAEKWFDKNQGS